MAGSDYYRIAVSHMDLGGKKLAPGDSRWAQFNASFDNFQMPMYLLLDWIYLGQAITTHHSNNWRKTENYLAGQHIGLDFDTEDERSTLDYLIRDPFISKYASFIHTTISHSAEKPRARVIFLLDQPIMQAQNYSLAAASLVWLFGSADRKCKDAVRFFYGAPKCDFALVNAELPTAVVKKLIHNYKTSGAGAKRNIQQDYQNPPTSQREVAEALGFIDPWQIDYDEWVNVLMAIHAEYGEGGLVLAESWGQGRPGEVAQKWRSFDQNGNVSGKVSIGTLFMYAKQFGWQRMVQ